MSIIGNVTAAPNRLEMLIDFVKNDTKSYTKNELVELFSPSNGSESSAVFDNVYTVADSLGLFNYDEQEKGSSKVLLNPMLKNQQLVNYIRDKIFEKEFIHKDKFSYALAWFLLQDPKNPLGWSDTLDIKVTSDLNNAFGGFQLSGLNKGQQFFYWCEYLGFSKKISVGSKIYVIPDPTKVIEKELVTLFENKKEVSVELFLNNLSKKIPVFETGWIRDEIEANAITSLKRLKGTISGSTSLALLRLEHKGKIKMLSKSDAEIFPLKGISKKITHIQYLGEENIK